MQAKVADMYVALQSARAYTYAVAKSCDAGQTTRFDAAGAILLASENAFKVAGEAVQALGGAGYTKDWPVERYLRDAKLLDIGAGTNEIRRMLIGRELIGRREPQWLDPPVQPVIDQGDGELRSDNGRFP